MMAPEELRSEHLPKGGQQILRTLESVLDGRAARAAMLAIIRDFSRETLYVPERGAVHHRLRRDIAETMLEDGEDIPAVMAETGLSQRTVQRIRQKVD
jgi:hypothetical protein